MRGHQNHTQGSHAPFPDTPWTLVREAQQGPDKGRLQALNLLLERYWRPLYAYYRSKKLGPQDAENLVQDFFYALISGKKLARVSPGVRFRHWLMACARNFLIDRQRRGQAQMRRPKAGVRSLEDLKRTGAAFEPSDHATPEDAFREAWRRDLLGRAFEAVYLQAHQQNRLAEYEIFMNYYADQPETSVTWKQLADKHHFDHWKQAKNKADWASRQLAAAIRREISKYVDTEEEVDEELRELLR